MMLRAGFDTFSGYGNDAVDMAQWFGRAGVDVVPWPTSVVAGLPRGFTDLLTKSPVGDYDVAVAFGPPFSIHPGEFADFARTAVGWSMWERTPLVPDDMRGAGWGDVARRRRWWSGPGRSAKQEKDWLDLMVVTCHDNVPAFQALDDGLPYEVCPNGVDPTRWPEVDRTGQDRPFTFASIGMLTGRKDPFATLEAWRIAQEADPSFDARLVLKTGARGLHPGIVEAYRNVEVITDAWPIHRVLDFYGEVDVLVSTSRGEGNNKPAMEFMSTGGPVMATNWAGHRNWLHPDTGYPLDGELRPIREGSPVQDFRVDVQHVAATFLHCWRNQAEVRRKGELAARTIRADLSWEKVCDRFLRQVAGVM